MDCIIDDLIGKRFGRLTVIERAPDYITPSDGRHRRVWRCQCDCGNIKDIRETCLKSGESKSCGCLFKETMSKIHSKHHEAGTRTRLYAIWDSMRQRCNSLNYKSYKDYGGRGIKVCEQWDDYSVFREWAYNHGYNEQADYGKCTLDRIDVNKGYSPDNCRFVSVLEQARNKRNSIWYTYNGESHPLTVWAEITGWDYTTLWKRYKQGRPLF